MAENTEKIEKPLVNPEYNYDSAFYLIETRSNLHAGSGGENYGIIDNLIQRDAATGFPCILASSMKGAFREYFKHYLDVVDKDEHINWIFGNEKDDDDQDSAAEKKEVRKEKNFAGKYRFLQADLISIPARSDAQLFFNATCEWLVDNFLQQVKQFHKTPGLETEYAAIKNSLGTQPAIQFSGVDACLETDDITAVNVTPAASIPITKKIIGEDFALLKDKHFIELVSDFNLPVIARNQLNDGRSGNLWYEQVLPRYTRLFFCILYPKGDKNFEIFNSCVNNQIIQIGANASVGYGYCNISLIKTEIYETKR